ncbi:MAG: nitrogen regulation protein NR(II) [Pseudomonadota bacterium]
MSIPATVFDSYSAAEPPDMFELLSTGALVIDAQGRLKRLNAAAEALLELSAKQSVDQPLIELWPDGELLHGMVLRAMGARGPVSDRELGLQLPSGQAITLHCTATPVPDSSAQPHETPAWVVLELVPVDRTRRINREEHLVSQNEIARTVIRGLAHEIRNPLGGIRGAAQLLERELIDPDLAEYTRVIIGEADRLQRLLDRLLGPRSRPDFRAMNIHEVTERVFTLLEAEVPAGVRVERDYDPSLPPVFGDPELLIQAVLNVARNAAQAVGERGCIRISTRIERYCTVGSSHYRMAVRIDIQDDGAGVPAELVDSLFYPLVTGRSDGTGLGLSIAQSLVHQHGGIIEFRRDEEATIFSFLIPIERAP